MIFTVDVIYYVSLNSEMNQPLAILKKARIDSGISQRRLAATAGLSYKSLQLIEGGRHNPEMASLEKIAVALGYPPGLLGRCVEQVFRQPCDSVWAVAWEMQVSSKRWSIFFFNFVDAFRRQRSWALIQEAPPADLPARWRALLASTVETLCGEVGMQAPDWCRGVGLLGEPWFVSEVDNLKATALLESPIHFRKRNIFVFNNFLERA